MEDHLRALVTYYTDKGVSRASLLAQAARELNDTIDKMLDIGELVTGEMHGSKDWLVVEKFMPNMAARLQAQAMGSKPIETIFPDKKGLKLLEQAHGSMGGSTPKEVCGICGKFGCEHVTVAQKSYEVVNDFKLTSYSLVDHCIYCGSKVFDKPGVHPHTGEVCNHPNRRYPIK